MQDLFQAIFDARISPGRPFNFALTFMQKVLYNTTIYLLVDYLTSQFLEILHQEGKCSDTQTSNDINKGMTRALPLLHLIRNTTGCMSIYALTVEISLFWWTVVEKGVEISDM
jgi:hypothetical protein